MVNDVLSILTGSNHYLLSLTVRILLSAGFVFLVTVVYAPPFIYYLRSKKLGQPIRELGPESHYSKSGTPVMGGVIFLVPTVLSTLLFSDLSSPMIHLLWLATIGYGMIGFVDDYRKLMKKSSDGMSARTKLLLQSAIALVIVFYLYQFQHYSSLYAPILNAPLIKDMGFWFVPFGVFVLVATSNAVNLTDGLDGLAMGLMCIASFTMAIFAYISNQKEWVQVLGLPFIPGGYEVCLFLCTLIAAGLGFLWFNSHPAQIFMGDTGSLALGGILGTVTLLLKKEIFFIFIGGIFITEALSVVIQVAYFKMTKGKRVFKMTPIHHHFELSGIPENKVTSRLWIMGILLSTLALAFAFL